MYLIVGLGNPENEYSNTRHNMGFNVVNKLSEKFNIKINKDSDIPLYRQIGDGICRLIEDGTLKANTRLPAIRPLAKSLGVNNDTIVSAYKYLINKKAAYSQVGSGTYVSPILLDEIPQPVAKENISPFSIWFNSILFDSCCFF